MKVGGDITGVTATYATERMLEWWRLRDEGRSRRMQFVHPNYGVASIILLWLKV